MKTHFLITLVTILSLGFVPASHALKTDNQQPATLDADEFDMDFLTGVRTYRGNVVYQQGSMRLLADELVAYFKDGELERAVARGNRAEFRQRPDDSDTDMVGLALRIEIDQVGQLVTLQNRAKVTQGANTVTGKLIVYNMQTEKVKVRSGKRKTAPASTTVQPAAGGSEGVPPKSVEEDTPRPRIVIQPRS